MTKSRIAYPTNLNDTENARIAPLLETKSKRGRPREITYREILNAIFYLLKTRLRLAVTAGRLSELENGVSLLSSISPVWAVEGDQ